jgi:hypothetical protein
MTENIKSQQFAIRLMKEIRSFLKNGGSLEEAVIGQITALAPTLENKEMANPKIRWLHALHQVTGTLASRWSRIGEKDRQYCLMILRSVLKEMEAEENWDDKNVLLLPIGGRPPE